MPQESLTESIAPMDDTSMNATIADKDPLLVRAGNKILGDSENKIKDSKSEPKKEIRRDSKGFEKFEDYFDSSFDDTTLKSNNVTAANDTRDANEASTREKAAEKHPENVSDKSKELAMETSSVQLLAEVAAKSSSSAASKTSTEDVEMADETLSSSTEKEIPVATSPPVASKSLPEKDISKNSEEKGKPIQQSTVKTDKSDSRAEAPSNKETEPKSVDPVRQQPNTEVERRQQSSNTNTTSTPADLSKDWDMDDDEADVEEEPQPSKKVNEKETTNKDDSKQENNDMDNAAETIENIESFIQEEPKDTSTPAVHKSKSMATITTKPSMSHLEAKVGEKRKLERTVGKRTEEWVTMIFGEDGKQVAGKADTAAKTQKKSVYDLNPDEEEFSSK